jgi:hypothetical protein
VKKLLRGATNVGFCSSTTSASFATKGACSVVVDDIEGDENEGLPSSVKNAFRGETSTGAGVSFATGTSLGATLDSTAGAGDIFGNVNDGLPLSVKNAVRGDTNAGLFSSLATGVSSGFVVGSAAGAEDTGGNVKDGLPSSVKKAVDGVASSDGFVAVSSTTGPSLGVSIDSS